MDRATFKAGFIEDDDDIEIYHNFRSNSASQEEAVLPEKIVGEYLENYNIVYIDGIIRKKLHLEKSKPLEALKKNLGRLQSQAGNLQKYVDRKRTMESIEECKEKIRAIESGKRLSDYISSTESLLKEYKKFSGNVRTIVFDSEEGEKYKELDEPSLQRINIIEEFLDIAANYIKIDIVRTNNRPNDICSGCGNSLAQIALNEQGTQRCPDCQTEHDVVILTKLSKDGSRINSNSNADDESIDNFIKAFTRYQGLQSIVFAEGLFSKLDNYFHANGRPSGKEISLLPLNDRGRRGDTNHKMMVNALSKIGHSEYYEDINLIGHKYWGWTLPNVMHLKECLISDYIKTQNVYYDIPPEKRNRHSSIGTQYRLWRGLQMRGHECYKSEFKIAENPDSDRTHDTLWKMMCDGCDDPNIVFIA